MSYYFRIKVRIIRFLKNLFIKGPFKWLFPFLDKKVDQFSTSLSPYQKIGGIEGVNRLVESFYHYMETLPEAKNCLNSHPGGVIKTRQKFKDFLSGWLGGPGIYIQKYGHPRMRMRHMPFRVGQIERNEWLLCMSMALNDLELEKTFENELMTSFEQFADFMVNA